MVKELIKLFTAYNYMQWLGHLSEISVEKYVIAKKLLKELSIDSIIWEMKRELFSLYSLNERDAYDVCESAKEFILVSFTIQELEELQCL